MTSNKVFLSGREDETGSICWKVKKGTDLPYYIEGHIKIYDCSRSVTLDFDCFDKEELAERVVKANILLDEVTKLRDELVRLNTRKSFYY